MTNQRPVSPVGALEEESGSGGGRLSGRVLPLLIGGVAIVVIIAALIVITNTGGTTTGAVSHKNTSQTGASLTQKHGTPAPFKASHVRVAVLNGTAQAGLAGDVGSKLAADGYRKGNITNAASQTEVNTFVYYMPGAAAKANRTAAEHVARALGLSASRVRRATQSQIQSCSISASGASLGSCRANAIVSVGTDRASLASSGSAG